MKLTSILTFLTAAIIAVHCVNAHPTFKPLPVEKRQDNVSVSNLKAIRDMVLNKYSNIIKSNALNNNKHQQVQKFPVVPTEEKKVSSIKLIRDGQANIYYSTINIGNQDFKVLFDTGSSDPWVPNKGCAGACKKSNKFDPKKSKTFIPEGNDWSAKYGAGKAEGVTGIDNVQIGGLTAENQTFGLANRFESDFVESWDGIIGLAFDKLNTVDGGAPTPITTLAKQGKIDPIFSFQFNQDDSGGIFTLGGTDNNGYQGDINFKPVLDHSGYWNIQIDDTIVNGKSLSLGSASVFDTGSPAIIMPPADANKIFKKIKGAKKNSDGSYTIPCNSKDSLSFKLNDGVYKVDLILGKDGGKCYACILAADIGSSWLVGHPFLKNVYSVFDMGKQRLGFATLK